MAIDFGLKILFDWYWRLFIEYLGTMGIIKRPSESGAIGPIEVMIQKGPLRIDYLIRTDNKYIIVESKSGKDTITSDDEYKLILYSVGVGRKYGIPAYELQEKLLIVILITSRENIKVPARKIQKGVYALKMPFNAIAICVEEAEIAEDAIWITIISPKLRKKLLQHALEKGKVKIIGTLILIDRDIRRLMMKQTKELIREAILEIGAAVGYGELLAVLGEAMGYDELLEVLGKAMGYDELLEALGEKVGYEKLIEIVLSILKKKDTKLIEALRKKLEQQ